MLVVHTDSVQLEPACSKCGTLLVLIIVIVIIIAPVTQPGSQRIQKDSKAGFVQTFATSDSPFPFSLLLFLSPFCTGISKSVEEDERLQGPHVHSTFFPLCVYVQNHLEELWLFPWSWEFQIFISHLVDPWAL